MKGAAIATDRATSFSGLRHSSAKTAELSKPERAARDIFARTAAVTSESAGTWNDSAPRASGIPTIHALPRRHATTAQIANHRIEVAPVSHLARCRPRTLT